MKPYIDIHTHTLKNSPEAIEILNLRAGKVYPNINATHLSYGIHPWDTNKTEIYKLIDQVNQIKNLTAIGECGLDKYKGANMTTQIELFKNHIHISERINKPLIIHCVGCFNELLALKKEIKPLQPWIIHGFNSHPQLAIQLNKANIYLSFGESLLKENSNAEKSLKILPAENWFLETDESALPIEIIYQQAAKITQTKLNDLKQQLANRFISIFAAQKLE